jgi:Zn-dependent M28 family amino/carboxypeptidase
MESQLRQDVAMLAGTIGERHLGRPARLAQAADWLEASFQAAGYAVTRQPFDVDGRTASNLEVSLPGTSDEVLVVGAHYDTVYATPGADDNGSGVAALLGIARALAGYKPRRTVRLVAFVNEEPPHFLTETMGSLVYARACHARGDKVVGMISLESIGYYDRTPGSQHFPLPELAALFPDRGDFLALVGNPASAGFLQEVATAFRQASAFPLETAPFPPEVPGVGWSDHWSFWQVGYPAVMATDTAPFRNPHYHAETDTPDTVSYPDLAEVTRAMIAVVRALAGP